MHQVSERSDPAALWLQRLAAGEPAVSSLPDAQALWWRAQALCRLDRQREVTAQLERSEYLSVGCAVVAALILFLCLLNMLSPQWQTMLWLFTAASGTLMGIGAFVGASDERRSARD